MSVGRSDQKLRLFLFQEQGRLGWPDSISSLQTNPKEKAVVTKSSIRKAIEQARGCTEGDLFLESDGKTAFFAVGMRDSLEYRCIYQDFRYLAEEYTFEKVVSKVRRWADASI
jgi:hypothetical protein